jgi:hypothetical protein
VPLTFGEAQMTALARIRICEISPDSPALLAPRLGVFAPANGVALGAMERLILNRHPAVAWGGVLGRGKGTVRLVVAPLSGSASEDELLLVSSNLASDKETAVVLRDRAARGGRHLFVQFERGEADLLPHLVWEHLARDWPEARLPDGLLWGLPCGFGSWTRELYRLSPNGERRPGVRPDLGRRRAQRPGRQRPPPRIRRLGSPSRQSDNPAKALRFLIHLAETCW